MTSSGPLTQLKSQSENQRVSATAANKALIFCSYRADIAEINAQNLIVWLAELKTTAEFTSYQVSHVKIRKLTKNGIL